MRTQGASEAVTLFKGHARRRTPGEGYPIRLLVHYMFLYLDLYLRVQLNLVIMDV